MSKKIKSISPETENAILRKSAYGLPDRPSASGMKTEDIKKAFYKAVIDEEDSVLSEFKRIVDETNDAIDYITGIGFDATATQLPSGTNPEVNINYNEETNKYEMNLGIPAGGGTDVTIGGEVQTSWSADFADYEKNRSKNLFELNYNGEFSQGTEVQVSAFVYIKRTDSGDAKLYGYKNDNRNIFKLVAGEQYSDARIKYRLANLKPNTDYVISYSPSSVQGTDLEWSSMFDASTEIGSYAERIITTNSNGEYNEDSLNTFLHIETTGGSAECVFAVSNIQIEEGRYRTSYSPYGAITHNGDKSVVFAENERQKSKNLFNINKARLGEGDNKGDIDYSNGTITLYKYYNQLDNTLKDIADLEVGKTYVLSLKSTREPKQIYLTNTAILWYSGEPLTITQEMLNDRVAIYGDFEGVATLSEIQIEEGTTATDYQIYGGRFIQEKDLEIKENLYSFDNAISITDSTLTTLNEYFDLFNLNKKATYIADIGITETSNFKTLVGNPLTSNYVYCTIKQEIEGVSQERYTCYKLTAISKFSSEKVAISYIYKLHVDAGTVIFTGWTKIGG